MATERRVERRMAATRERLVNTALALFAKQGIYATTVEDVTEAADVGKGTFYQHFPSKTAIIRHLLHEGFGELLNQCRHEVQSAVTAQERVERLLEAQFRFFGKRRDLLILFHQVRGLIKLQPKEARFLKKEYERYIRFLASQLAASLDGKRYSEESLQQMACAMAGLVTGYLSYLVILGLKTDRGTELEISTRMFLKGIVEPSQ
ncbi:TetR/AcrR family transcriptional regulator [Candidatus Methylomirabilis sp.]|uniref:TetR/AcrR family transcriptional regulator n=1 Tax=Candidatus Methylomirabilis sp. TaxID=2032687 RepID=UPI002A641E64|nr:TetR/AcrR family transcriptional regulator [Candidatus Methylomirabilis sp.]